MMASRLLNSRTRITAYLPNLQSLVRHFTGFPTQTEDEGAHLSEEQQFKLGPFGSQSELLPLPGNIGITSHMVPPTPPCPKEATHINNRHLALQTLEDKHVDVFTHAVLLSLEANRHNSQVPRLAPYDMLEFTVQECPTSLKKEFAGLFPDMNLMEGPLTVVTISHRTENDMSGWSEEVENEREMLLDKFVKAAKCICESLGNHGSWADFIDPSSGMPFYGQHTNSVFFETDERYKKLGFDIEDLGCCKAISHPIWGTHAYIGCLFTSATLDNPILESIVHFWGK